MTETRSCQNCKKDFVIEQADFDFYKKVDVPPPTFCPDCRLQRRMTWRNERALYKRQCDLCQKAIFAMYPAKTPFPVYCHDCWFSDKWDPMRYGRDYDFTRNFFAQFRDLLEVVPRIALQVERIENSDYTNQILDCKNCYLVNSAVGDEDCMFCYRVNYSRNVLESYSLIKCENVYEGSMGRESANVFYSEGFADSHDIFFCDEPRGCQNCFMTTNLRRKSYVFRGEELSKEEYKERMSQIDFGSHAVMKQLWKEFDTMTLSAIRPHGTFKNVVNTTGNAIANAKDCRSVFHGSNQENCRYTIFIDDGKDSMDVNNGGHIMELNYEMNTTGARSYNSKLCNDAWPEVTNLTYCDSCRSGAKDLFGCVSLRGGQYCILNKQYSKEEYDVLIKKIAEHMNVMPYVDVRGLTYAYGEFFPSELSLFPYNDSMAQDYFQLSPEEVAQRGWKWAEPVEKNIAITLSPESVPDNIKDVDDSILGEVVGCEHGGGCHDRCSIGFRITPMELRFYRKYHVPIPRMCPNCRNYARLKRRNPFKLWHRQCMCDKKHLQHEGKCSNEFETSYAPDRKEIIYCESCYNAEVA